MLSPEFFSTRAFNLLNVSSLRAISSLNAESLKINLIGNVVSSLETSVSNYGLNSALIKVYANVEVTEQIIIPFTTKDIKIVNKVPIAIKVIQGKVPEYYSDGKLNNSSNILSIPIEKNT